MAQASLLFKNFVSGLTSLYDKDEATSITRVVFKERLNISRTDIAIDPSLEISKNDKNKLDRISKKLLEGVPVQHILGYADFYGLKFKVNKNVLIPRPETEELVQWIIKENGKKTGIKILDVGTGTGCISIALAKELMNASVTGIDISDKALRLARINAKMNDAKVQFKELDVLQKSNWNKLGKFNIIVSNPPYVTEREKEAMHINVLNHDPHLALFVPDDDPLIFYNKISDMALLDLSPGGQLYFEINEAFGNEIKDMLEAKGFKHVVIRKDLNGKDRFAIAVLET